MRALLSGRGLLATLIVVIACSAPLLAAIAWLGTGVSGPVHPVASQLVPELVAVADGQSHQVRTLVVRESGGQVSYVLLRGPSPSLADASLIAPASAQRALSRVVSELTTPDASLAVSPAQHLAGFDIGYVLVQAPVAPQLDRVLDGMIGLRLYSTTASYSLWQVSTPPARVALAEPDGTVVPIPSGPVGVSGARLPSAGGTLLLAEPAGDWRASVNGHALTPVPSPAGSWAQAFRVPAGGGTLDLGYPGFGRDLVLLFELLAFLAVAGLALPGMHVAEPEPQRATAPSTDADADTDTDTESDEELADADAGERQAGVPVGRGAALAGLSARAGSARAGSARALRGGRGRGRGRSRVGAAGKGRAGRGGDDRDRDDRDRGDREGRRPAVSRRGSQDADAPQLDAGQPDSGQPDAGQPDAARPGSGRFDSSRFDSGQPGSGEMDAFEPDDAGFDAGADSGQFDATELYAAGPDAGRRGRSRSADRDLGGREPQAHDYSDRPEDDRRDRESRAGRTGRPWPDRYESAAHSAGPGEAGTRPYSLAEDARGDSRLTGAWPNPPADREKDRSITGPPGWPYPASPAEPGEDGRSPAASGQGPAGASRTGRSPSGAWPYPDISGEPGRDDDRGPARAGRSPSGAWPLPREGSDTGGNAEAGGYDAGRDRDASRHAAGGFPAGDEYRAGGSGQADRGYQAAGGGYQNAGGGYQAAGGHEAAGGYRAAGGYEQAGGYRAAGGYQVGDGYQAGGGYGAGDGYGADPGYDSAAEPSGTPSGSWRALDPAVHDWSSDGAHRPAGDYTGDPGDRDRTAPRRGAWPSPPAGRSGGADWPGSDDRAGLDNRGARDDPRGRHDPRERDDLRGRDDLQDSGVRWRGAHRGPGATLGQDDWAAGDDWADDEGADGDGWTGSDRWSSAHGRSAQDISAQDISARGRSAEGRSAHGREDEGRYDEGGRDRADRGSRVRRGESHDRDSASVLDRARSGPAGRWSRHDRDELDGDPLTYSARGEPAASGWSGGDDDALEPLPPVEGPRRDQGRRGAWHPAEQDQGGWDDLDQTGAASRRWSSPAEDYEPEYEGETW